MSRPSSTEEAKASVALLRGGIAATVGSLLAVAVPAALVLLARARLAGLASGTSSLIASEALLAVVGGVLVVVAFFLYRRAFSHLTHADRRIRPVVALCLVGSLGTLAVVIAGAYVAGSASAISSCVNGQTAHALSCLRSHDPAAGWLAIAGFWLLWVGAVGVAVGLMLAGRHYRSAGLSASGALYAVLVADLTVAFAGLVIRLPGSAYLLGVAPFAAVLASVLVLWGARSLRGT